MKIEIDFPFHSWTKRDLLEFCYGKNADVDTAIPQSYVKPLYDLTGDWNAHHFYVMDYTDNKIGGRLVNLKEKFFSKIAELAEASDIF